MKKTEIFKKVDSEISYQDLKEKNNNKSISDYIIKIEHHLNEAKNAKYYSYDDECLSRVRKIAALAIQCLEDFGCPERIVDPDKSLHSE